jgi:hypothetical protein
MADEIAERAFNEPLTLTIVNFLIHIGLEVRSSEIGERTFLPGIMIERGTLRIDKAKLKYPGDLLHEAGHLALMSPGRRSRVQVDSSQSVECSAGSANAQVVARRGTCRRTSRQMP